MLDIETPQPHPSFLAVCVSSVAGSQRSGVGTTQPSTVSHLPAHYLSFIELLKGRGVTFEWNLHPPTCRDRCHPVAALRAASLSEHLVWICRKAPHELLDVGVTHAKLPRNLAEGAFRVLIHEPLTHKALDYARLLRAAPRRQRFQSSCGKPFSRKSTINSGSPIKVQKHDRTAGLGP